MTVLGCRSSLLVIIIIIIIIIMIDSHAHAGARACTRTYIATQPGPAPLSIFIYTMPRILKARHVLIVGMNKNLIKIVTLTYVTV